MACTNKRTYESVAWCDGKPVMPGIRRAVYFQSKSNIVKWPTLPDLDKAESMAESATYTGDFTLAESTKWLRLDCLQTKSDCTSEVQGEFPCITALNKATLFYAGTDEAVTGFCRTAMQDDLVFLVQQNDGKFRVVGSENYDRTTVSPSQTTGQGVKSTDAGTTINVEATDVCPAPFYPGKIETEDGDISGKDGGAVI